MKKRSKEFEKEKNQNTKPNSDFINIQQMKTDMNNNFFFGYDMSKNK